MDFEGLISTVAEEFKSGPAVELLPLSGGAPVLVRFKTKRIHPAAAIIAAAYGLSVIRAGSDIDSHVEE